MSDRAAVEMIERLFHRSSEQLIVLRHAIGAVHQLARMAAPEYEASARAIEAHVNELQEVLFER